MNNNAKIAHVAGPLSPEGAERKLELRDGISYPDSWTTITYKGVTIYFFGDTYTPNGDRMPSSAEQARFAKLDRNAADLNRMYVRMPKPWSINEKINPRALSKFTEELCKEVKKAVDEGKIGEGKDKLNLERFYEELIKKKESEAHKTK
jgi:hypothetical protein